MVENPLSACLGLETQPCYKAPGNIIGGIVENALINNGLVRLFTRKWFKVGYGTVKQQLKKLILKTPKKIFHYRRIYNTRQF